MRRGFAPLPPRWLALGLVVLAAWSTAGAAWGQEGPQSPAFYLAPSGYRPKEFTLVRDRGWFHIFYIRENLLAGVPTEQSLGHAVSRDLYHWTELDTILPVIPGTYEGSEIWAPHALKIGDTWHLFYAVMRNDPAQGYHLAQWITDATSPDLTHWTRRDAPLFDNAIFPWSYYDTTVAQGRDCRDPFVWWDDTRGEWLMFVATRPASAPQSMVIGIAGSTDLVRWEDRGFVPITLPAYSFSDVAESPGIFRRDAGSPLLLVWTTNSGNALTYGTSTDALTGWGGLTRLKTMLGYTTLGWWATEPLNDGKRKYLASVDDTWIQFWDLTWRSPYAFNLSAPDSAQILDAGFDRASAASGDTVAVFGRMVHGAGRALALRYVRVRGAVSDTLAGASFGFPDTLAMTGDSTAMLARIPTSLVGNSDCLLTVVAADGTAGPDTLLLKPPDPGPEPLDPELPLMHPRLIVLVRPAEVRFVRERATVAWDGEVFDVRGRRLWTGRAEAGQRTLAWRPGKDGGTARVRPGIYFARLREAGGPPQTLKVPWPGN